MEFTIRKGRKSDAPDIARAIINAVGEEIAMHFAGSEERRPLVDRLFTELAEAEDSQYSYLNSLVAEAEDGKTAGIIVAYDGARLHELRRAFIRKAAEILCLELDETKMHDETSPDEIYLDSLAVWPEYQRQGLARKLIAAAGEAHKESGKPLGLLCEPENLNAFALYQKLGFGKSGMKFFADTMMHHMVKPIY